MNYDQFFLELIMCRKNYRWVDEDGEIRGYAKNGIMRGLPFTPIEAVYRSSRYRNPSNNLEASYKLNVPTSIVKALANRSNRGNSQVVVGRIKAIVRAKDVNKDQYCCGK